LKKIFDKLKHTHGLVLEVSRVCISGEGGAWSRYTADVGDRSLAAVAILYTGAYGHMEVDKSGARYN
jgi:hypothetical protein